MARQQAVQLRVRPVAVDYRSGQSQEYGIIHVEAAPTDTLGDIEKALVKGGYVPPPQPGQNFKWFVVTASGDEAPVSHTDTVGKIVDMYQPRELKLLFDTVFG